jgi:hypothetical protein
MPGKQYIRGYAKLFNARRAEIVNQLVAHFDASGVEYTCGAAVINTVEGEAQRLCTLAASDGFEYNVRNLCRRAWDTVHKRWSNQR